MGVSHTVIPFSRGRRETKVCPKEFWGSRVPTRSELYSCDASGSFRVIHPDIPEVIKKRANI
jgi:hypothetical protein